MQPADESPSPEKAGPASDSQPCQWGLFGLSVDQVLLLPRFPALPPSVVFVSYLRCPSFSTPDHVLRLKRLPILSKENWERCLFRIPPPVMALHSSELCARSELGPALSSRPFPSM